MNIPSILRFHSRAAALKTVDRAGWRRCGVGREDCESVADHTFGVALLALLLPRLATDEKVDVERCVALALVHDLAEAIVGDITPHDGVAPADKHAREQQAMRELADLLDDERVLVHWEEFESASTPEARLVRDLDVIEMAMQAKAYEGRGILAPTDAARFVESASPRVTTTTGRAILDAVERG